MCGRFVVAGNKADLVTSFEVQDAPADLRRSWNVAPMTDIPLITEKATDGELTRRLETARWGLVPVWAKDPKIGSRMINARSETILEKPSFRKAAVKRRALVPADGYYEWLKNDDGSKTPIYLHPEDENALLGFAALYEFWPDPSQPEGSPEKWLMTATILTRPATDALGHIHDRTPVIVPPDLRGDWLNPALADGAEVKQLLDAIPEPHLLPRVVDKAVGNVRNDGPHLIEPVGKP
jgi:putative SOS response-associated peptidase YedK